MRSFIDEKIEFNRLDQNMRQVFNKNFMAKGIYMNRFSSHINQRLTNLVINEQFPIGYKNNIRKYKKIYSVLKV